LFDGIEIKNATAVNSYRGSMGTDRGPWSLSAAEGLGKDLFYCCRHESEGIMTAAAGLIVEWIYH
jgi:hypothetical protein